MIELIKYLLLGLIQGLTEPLPISSSAHMALVANFFHMDSNNIDFEIFVNFGSALAIIWFLRKNIINDFFILNNRFKLNYSLILKLLVASIAVIFTGYFFKDSLKLDNYHLGIMLIITSLLLLISRLLIVKATKERITMFNALTLGLFQSVAIIPGLSRSGTVLLGGLSQKIKTHQLLTFSFYMYLIVSFGALIIAIPKLNIALINPLNMSLAFLGAVIATTVSIKYLYRLINQKTLFYFALYALLIGILLIKIS